MTHHAFCTLLLRHAGVLLPERKTPSDAIIECRGGGWHRRVLRVLGMLRM